MAKCQIPLSFHHKGHCLQGLLVEILAKIRVTLIVQLVDLIWIRVTCQQEQWIRVFPEIRIFSVSEIVVRSQSTKL